MIDLHGVFDRFMANVILDVHFGLLIGQKWRKFLMILFEYFGGKMDLISSHLELQFLFLFSSEVSNQYNPLYKISNTPEISKN